jgi:glutaredoxin
MSQFLECHLYFDSRQAQPDAPEACGDRIDLAADAAAADRLVHLGISPEADLPAVLLTEPGGKLRIVGLRLSGDEAGRLAAGDGIPASRVTVYSSSWCPDCRRAKRVLEEAEAPFEEVDIDQSQEAESMVLQRSGGRRVVPTLRFDDRVWAFNPDPPLLRRLLSGTAQGETLR